MVAFPGSTGQKFSFNQIEQLWVANGGDPNYASVMAAIAEAESGGVTNNFNPNASTGDYSVGLWQINYFGNLLQGRTAAYGSPSALANDPNLQAKAAVSLEQGSPSLSPWKTDAAWNAWVAAGKPIPWSVPPSLTGGAGSSAPIVGTGTAPSATPGTLLSAPVSSNTSLSPVGTVLKYLDGFLNPKVSAVPSIVNTFTGTNAILSAVFTLVDRLVVAAFGVTMISVGIFVMVRSNGSSPVNSVLSAARAGTGVGNVVLRGKELGLAQQREVRMATPKAPRIETPPIPEVPPDVIDAEWWEDVPDYTESNAPALNP